MANLSFFICHAFICTYCVIHLLGGAHAKLERLKKGQSGSFLGKELGWELYEELPSHNLTVKPIVKPEYTGFHDPKIKLYISISSFRDKLCPITLKNLFTKAKFPERVYPGVVEQNAEGDVPCLETYCELMRQLNSSWVDCPYKDQIRMDRVSASEARGPTWARARASLLLQDEEFCMQTDSHMDFLPNWDIKMIDMWASTDNEYAVLSTYVASTETYDVNMDGQKGTNGRYEVPHLCMVHFHGSHGMIRVWGTKCMANMFRPKMTNIVWGAGLSFSKCHAERKAPYDPHTPGIFDGEEFSRAIRFWTYGYDVYSPHRVYVVHNYHKSQSDPKHFTWMSGSQTNTNDAVRRLKTLVGMKEGGATDPAEALQMQQSKYGLGDRRTLDQAIAFSGIDTKNREIVGNKCGNLDYVPFTEHPFGVEFVPRFDPVTEAPMEVVDPGSIYFDSQNAQQVSAWEQAVKEREEGRGRSVLRIQVEESSYHVHAVEEGPKSQAAVGTRGTPEEEDVEKVDDDDDKDSKQGEGNAEGEIGGDDDDDDEETEIQEGLFIAKPPEPLRKTQDVHQNDGALADLDASASLQNSVGVKQKGPFRVHDIYSLRENRPPLIPLHIRVIVVLSTWQGMLLATVCALAILYLSSYMRLSRWHKAIHSCISSRNSDVENSAIKNV